MPLYAYRCVDPECGHMSEELRKYLARRRAAICPECGQRAEYILSAHHRQPDGIYSYAPNIGSASDYERKHHDATERQKRIDGGMYDG